MSQNHRWLAALALVAVVGCQQTSSKTSGAMSGDGSSSGSGSMTTGTSANGSTSGSAGATTTTISGTSAPAAQEVTLPDGLKMQDMKVGDGALAEDGSTVSVHYTGWLVDGTKFDSSLDHGQPYTFRLGTGNVIKGWDEGLKGMRVGGKRKLTIPPALAYGARGMAPVIPPNATLVFDTELVSVR